MSSIQKRPDGVWRARYRDAAGKEHARHFARQKDAQQWLNEVSASILTGRYVSPGAGRITFQEFAEQWRKGKLKHAPATAEHVERHFRNHVYPAIGKMPLEAVDAAVLQDLVLSLNETLAPATVQVIFRHISSALKAAERGRRIAVSPCPDVELLRVERKRVVVPTTETVWALASAVPERYRALIVVAAGTGMRQGEVFGMTYDRVEPLLLHQVGAAASVERSVRVDRQLVGLSGREPTFGPTKTKKERVIPLPNVVADALLEHMQTVPVGPEGLIFSTVRGGKLRRSAFGDVWRRATQAVGVDGLVFHQLRHYYASLLIRHGESVKVVQERLGHASAQETLDTYSHLWHDADDRTRSAVDGVLGVPADQLRTGRQA